MRPRSRWSARPIAEAGELQEETALLVSMGYVEFWPHAVKDRRVADACRAAVEAAPAAQRPAFLELEDAFASADGAQAGRFLTNNVQLPGSGEAWLYRLRKKPRPRERWRHRVLFLMGLHVVMLVLCRWSQSSARSLLPAPLVLSS